MESTPVCASEIWVCKIIMPLKSGRSGDGLLIAGGREVVYERT